MSPRPELEPILAAHSVRIASSDEDLNAIGRLRYSVYVEEFGRRLASADHHSRLVLDSSDASALHLVIGARQLAACVRLHMAPIPEALAEPLELWRFDAQTLETACLVSKLMIDGPYRCSTVCVRLLRAIYSTARANGARMLFCTTFPHLLPMYRRIGFRVYKGMHIDPDFGPHYALIASMPVAAPALFRNREERCNPLTHC